MLRTCAHECTIHAHSALVPVVRPYALCPAPSENCGGSRLSSTAECQWQPLHSSRQTSWHHVHCNALMFSVPVVLRPRGLCQACDAVANKMRSCTVREPQSRCTTTRNSQALRPQTAWRPLGNSAAWLCSCHVLSLLLELLVHRSLFVTHDCEHVSARWLAVQHGYKASDSRKPNPQALPPLSTRFPCHCCVTAGTYTTFISRLVPCLVLRCVMNSPPSKRMS